MALITITELSNINWTLTDFVPALMQDDVQVWRVRVPNVGADIQSYNIVLNAAEKDRASRFVQPEDALRYIAAHNALRQLLSQITGIAPDQLVFTKNEFGKPALALHHNTANIHFNLSHSGQYVIIGLSKHPVGVDVEYLKNNFSFRSLLPHYFSTAEAQYITASPSPVKAFFRSWTLKEALGKGLGSGITENMQKLPCLNGIHQSTALIAANDWNVQTFWVDEEHMSSVSCSRNAGDVKFFDYTS
jgi:4'-phosphopantetheinyl transferase